jgi:hypothetical protein
LSQFWMSLSEGYDGQQTAVLSFVTVLDCWSCQASGSRVSSWYTGRWWELECLRLPLPDRWSDAVQLFHRLHIKMLYISSDLLCIVCNSCTSGLTINYSKNSHNEFILCCFHVNEKCDRHCPQNEFNTDGKKIFQKHL